MEETNKPSYLDEIKSFIMTFLSMIGELFELVKLEAKLTGKSLLSMLILIISTCFLVMSAWIAFIVSIAIALIMSGVSFIFVAIGILILHLLIIVPILFLINHHRKHIGFPVTQKQLGLNKE